jgi:hypothetical protein
MIDLIMYQGIGFLAAGVFLLMLVPFVHDRAVRITTRRVEDAQPSWAEVLADKDLQRAAFAMSVRQLESSFKKSKTSTRAGWLNLVEKPMPSTGCEWKPMACVICCTKLSEFLSPRPMKHANCSASLRSGDPT